MPLGWQFGSGFPEFSREPVLINGVKMLIPKNELISI